jgi:hypothetical protein
MARMGDGSVSFEHVTGTLCREAKYRRRCQGRWRGIVDLGKDEHSKRRTPRVPAATKAEAQSKLGELRAEIAREVRPRAGYTVAHCVADWHEHGLSGLAPKTASTNREMLDPLTVVLGQTRLSDLGNDDVRNALVRYGQTRSSRAVQMGRGRLVRAIRQAQASGLVSRNVAELDLATGRQGLQGNVQYRSAACLDQRGVHGD